MARLHIYIIALAVVFLAACENSIDPYVDSEAHAYAVFGYLDVGTDTQRVRVTAIRPAAGGDEPQPSIPVKTTNLASGESITWTHSLVPLDDGGTALMYVAPFRPVSGNVYAMEIGGGDAATLRAFTRVPATPVFEVGSTMRVGSDIVQIVAWTGVRSPSDVVLSYQIGGGPNTGVTEVDIPYAPRNYSTAGDRVTVSANLTRDFQRIRDELPEQDLLELRGARATVRALSEEWDRAPSGANIENGEGFFASVGEFTDTWTIPDSIAQQVGFSLPRTRTKSMR